MCVKALPLSLALSVCQSVEVPEGIINGLCNEHCYPVPIRAGIVSNKIQLFLVVLEHVAYNSARGDLMDKSISFLARSISHI